jgi:hypothetical protein
LVKIYEARENYSINFTDICIEGDSNLRLRGYDKNKKQVTGYIRVLKGGKRYSIEE